MFFNGPLMKEKQWLAGLVHKMWIMLLDPDLKVIRFDLWPKLLQIIYIEKNNKWKPS